MTTFINNCDGCRAGLPVEHGTHYSKGTFTSFLDRLADAMGCTADRYLTAYARELGLAWEVEYKPAPREPWAFRLVRDGGKPIMPSQVLGETYEQAADTIAVTAVLVAESPRKLDRRKPIDNLVAGGRLWCSGGKRNVNVGSPDVREVACPECGRALRCRKPKLYIIAAIKYYVTTPRHKELDRRDRPKV